MTAGSRTPLTPGAVFAATVHHLTDYPGVLVVSPHSSETSGRGGNDRCGPAPMLVIQSEADPDLVVEAAEEVGRLFGHKVRMRRAAQAWLHSKDADRHRRDVDITARNACIKEVGRNFRGLTEEEQYLRRALSWGLFNELLDPGDVLARDGDDPADEMPTDATREQVAANLRTLP